MLTNGRSILITDVPLLLVAHYTPQTPNRCPIIVSQPNKTEMTTPNWQHNSNKNKKTKGTCKGQLKARKQALQSLKLKLNFK